MKFSLIHPSRGRPNKAVSTAGEWLTKAGDVEVEWIISLDQSDPTLPKYHDELIQHKFPHRLVIADNKSVVEATNMGAVYADGDVLIYVSDDFSPPDRWGEKLELEIKTHIYGDCWLLKVDDCLQPFHVAVLTIPIMSKKLYNTLGYFWHPSYKSMFVDEDLYWTCKNNGWLKVAPNLKFEHKHPSVGKADNDETYINSAKNWDSGKATYQERKRLNFPLCYSPS
jgi:glycosyltransferase involved in cell wall biosynthesis